MTDLDLDFWRGTLNPQQHKDGNTTFICHTNERFTSLSGDIFLISYHSSLPAYLFNYIHYTTCAIADIKFICYYETPLLPALLLYLIRKLGVLI